MKTSWVIVSTETGKAIVETWDKRRVDKILRDYPGKYRAVPVREWLSALSQSAKGP